jgi:caffeoyl-CoA O-methyltransferase
MLSHDPLMERYCAAHSSPLPEVLYELERATHLRTTQPRMLSGELQGNFLRMLVSISQSRYIVEVGTFTGYSAICMALGMPEGGKLITLEVDDEMKPFHTEFFPKAGVDQIIEVRYGDAMEAIEKLDDEIDLVFIDADKKNYPHYYEKLLPKVRKGGLILSDNVLWSGKVYQEGHDDKSTQVLHAYNQMITKDERVTNILSYLRDGLMICQKK